MQVDLVAGGQSHGEFVSLVMACLEAILFFFFSTLLPILGILHSFSFLFTFFFSEHWMGVTEIIHSEPDTLQSPILSLNFDQL